jgi:hypothetical protein
VNIDPVERFVNRSFAHVGEKVLESLPAKHKKPSEDGSLSDCF